MRHFLVRQSSDGVDLDHSVLASASKTLDYGAELIASAHNAVFLGHLRLGGRCARLAKSIPPWRAGSLIDAALV